MKVLVTGATGFTGSRLARRLLDEGNEVRVLVRNKSGLQKLGIETCDVVVGDIADPLAVLEAASGTEAIFNLAALYRTAGVPDQAYWDVHVRGTENVVRAAREVGVKQLIHCSTVGVHGHIARPPADEDYPFAPGDLYQKSKLEGELTARRFGRESGIPVTVIRPCAIYGPGDLRLLKLFKMAARKRPVILGSGEIFYHMVHVDDLVQGFMLTLGNPRAFGEVFIIGGSECKTLNELVRIMAGCMGHFGDIVHLPVKPVRWLSGIVEDVCIPLGIEPPIYRRRVDFFTKSRCFSIRKAETMLGFRPAIPIEEGIRRTLDWYVQEGYLRGGGGWRGR